MTDEELNAELKKRGMFSLEEMLEGNILGEFSTHVGVTDFDSLLDWTERKQKDYLRMRLKYEIGETDTDDYMYEWVLAHSAAFGTFLDHLRKIQHTVVTK